jgi:hypothetical protein
MAKGQDQATGIGPFDTTRADTHTPTMRDDSHKSLEVGTAHMSFHCCACYEKAVEYDHATVARDLLEKAVSVAGDVVIDAKFGKEDTEEARAFLMDFIRKHKARL